MHNSTDSFPVELAASDSQQQRVKEYQAHEYSQHGQVRELGDERSTQALARVDEGIYQDDSLEDRKVCQSAPGIVGTAKKNHWGQNHAEHEADMSLTNAAAKGKTATGREKSHEQRNSGEAQGRTHVQFHAR